MSDDYTRILASKCYSADTCTLDSSCPFLLSCHVAEARDGEDY